MSNPEQPITEDAASDFDPVQMRDGVVVSMSIPLPPLPMNAPSVNRIHPDAHNWSPATPVESPVPESAPAVSLTPDTGFTGTTFSSYSPLDMKEAEVGDPAYDDNIEAAMHDIAEDMDLTVSAMSKEDDGPADKQVLIRATEHDRERWKRAAEVAGVSLSALVREVMNAKATDILDCSHPPAFRKVYPWAEFCTKCDMRLSG